jgi:mono/diheme cytochrome c family protein
VGIPIKFATAIAVIMLPMIANAVELGDAQQGLTYAKRVCAECHAVEAGEEQSPHLNAPTFDAVAKTPGMTERALIVWLQTSHPTMPNLVIPDDDTDNIIAYIMSLRGDQ